MYHQVKEKNLLVAIYQLTVNDKALTHSPYIFFTFNLIKRSRNLLVTSYIIQILSPRKPSRVSWIS